MNWSLTRFLWLFFTFNVSLSAQSALNLKLQLMPDSTSWGVYVKPDSTISPSPSTVTGSGQVTIVAPNDFVWNNLTNHAGNWSNNATVTGPSENPDMTYYSFGLVTDNPHITYYPDSAILLFTIKKVSSCPDTLYLIDNEEDPFAPSAGFPNSINSNPGNEMSVFDYINIEFYGYAGNYGHSAWSCADCDNDGIPNALEDTNGDGQWTPGVDVSNLCGSNGNGGCMPPVFAQHPQNVKVCEGNETLFSAQAGNLLYQWQASADGGVSWTNLYNNPTFNGVDTDTLFITNTGGMHGYQFRVVAAADTCISFSNTAEIFVEGPITITGQPLDQSACPGTEVTFEAEAEAVNSTLQFQWQMSTNGLVWVDIDGNTGGGIYTGYLDKTLKISDVSGLHGHRYRLAVSTGVCSAVYSEVAKLSLEGQVLITSQPQNFSTCLADEAVFTVSVQNTPGSVIHYQWQESSDNGQTWSNLPGAQSDVLTLTDIAGKDNYKYRVSIWPDGCDGVTSNSATLQIDGQLKILAQPQSDLFCPMGQACFELEVNNQDDPGLTYQWQIKPANFNAWVDLFDNVNVSGSQTAQVCINQPVNLAGTCVRAVIASGCGNLVSEKACIGIRDDLAVVTQPQDVTVCHGETAFFNTELAWDCKYDGVSFQWEVTSDGLNYSPETVSSPGETGLDSLHDYNKVYLAFSPESAMNNKGFRLRVVLPSKDTVYTGTAWLTVRGPVKFDQQPANKIVCFGEEAVFEVTAVSETGETDIFYQWESSADGLIWADVSDNNVFNGAAGNSLKINNSGNMNGLRFRCRAGLGLCSWQTSAIAQLTVEGPLSIALQPQDAASCPDSALVFVANVVNAGVGNLDINWQMSDSNGATWEDLAENQTTGFGGTYAGTASSTLSISRSEGLDGFLYRLFASTTACNISSATATLTEDEDLCPVPIDLECLKMKIRWMPGAQRWGVFVKPDGFTPPAYTTASSGRVTLVTPVGFTYQNLVSSAGGTWQPGAVLFNPQEAPGMQFMTFNLTPNSNQLMLEEGGEVMLFSIEKAGACPTDIYLMQNVPAGLLPNELAGTGLGFGFGPDVHFHLCGIYEPYAGYCHPPATSSMILNQPVPPVQASGNTPSGTFSVSPNPAGDWVNISFENIVVEHFATLQLRNLQGQLLRSERVGETGNLQLNLDGLAPGLYFLALEADGKVVQREKLVKE